MSCKTTCPSYSKPLSPKTVEDQFFDILYRNGTIQDVESFLGSLTQDQRLLFVPTLQNSKGYTALHICCIVGNVTMAAWLVDFYLQTLRLSHVNLEQTDKNRYTCLHYACNEDDYEMVRLLLFGILEQYGGGGELSNCNFDSRVQIESNLSCIKAKNNDTVSYLGGGNMIPVYATGGRSVMHYCAERGAVDCARVVMDFLNQYAGTSGASITKTILEPDLDGYTPYRLSILNSSETRVDHAQYFFELQQGSFPHDTVQESMLTNEDKRRVRAEIIKKQAERATRRKLEKEREEKQASTTYEPKYVELLSLEDSFLNGQLLDALETNQLLDTILKEEIDEVYSLPMANVDEFCVKLIDEMMNFEQSGIKVKRPNSMNNYGIVLDQLGLEVLVADIIERVMKPIARQVFPDLFVQGEQQQQQQVASTDKKPLNFHSFIVRYALGEDTDLDEHVDSSTITLNLSLGQEFTGGEVFFQDLHNSQLYHDLACTPGTAFIHRGNRRHGARQLLSGSRSNLIIWWRL